MWNFMPRSAIMTIGIEGVLSVFRHIETKETIA